MIEILFTYFDTSIPDEEFDDYFREMPERVREWINRYSRWQDRQSALYGRLLLVEGFKQHASNVSYDPLQRITYNVYGRPFIKDAPDFNISHSGSYVVCSIANRGKVGIDIEKIRDIKISDFDKYIPKTYREKMFPADDQLIKFYKCWTINESVLKAHGCGMSIKDADVLVEDNKIVLNDSAWYLNEILIDPGYCCYIATSIENPAINITAVDFNSKAKPSATPGRIEKTML